MAKLAKLIKNHNSVNKALHSKSKSLGAEADAIFGFVNVEVKQQIMSMLAELENVTDIGIAIIVEKYINNITLVIQSKLITPVLNDKKIWSVIDGNRLRAVVAGIVDSGYRATKSISPRVFGREIVDRGLQDIDIHKMQRQVADKFISVADAE